VEELKARIDRAWTMMLRSKERGDTGTAERWLHEWKNLCNKAIQEVEL
jgi:hypothetical protein